MNEASGRAAAVERAVVDLMETRELEHRIGEEFAAVALDHSARGTTIWIEDPPVRARLHSEPAPPLGEALRVRLVRADPASRSLQFVRA
jgi:exoribonuclease R